MFDSWFCLLSLTMREIKIGAAFSIMCTHTNTLSGSTDVLATLSLSTRNCGERTVANN